MNKILLVGYGKMGSSLVKGWLKRGLKLKISVIEKKNVSSVFEKNKINFFKSFEDYFLIKESPNIVLIAVKPQQLLSIVEYLNKLHRKNMTFVSVAAGISTKWYKDRIAKEIKIVRAMPNLPASVLTGITGIFYSKNILNKEIKVINLMLKSIGEIVLLKKENLIDIVTSISGSGPAYFFYLTELLLKIGQEFGLNKKDAKVLAVQTFIGSAKLLEETKKNVSELRNNVTSPGGTTEAALSVLMKQNDGFDKIMFEAIKSAVLKAKELNRV